jgi:hypothetical protein
VALHVTPMMWIDPVTQQTDPNSYPVTLNVTGVPGGTGEGAYDHTQDGEHVTQDGVFMPDNGISLLKSSGRWFTWQSSPANAPPQLKTALILSVAAHPNLKGCVFYFMIPGVGATTWTASTVPAGAPLPPPNGQSPNGTTYAPTGGGLTPGGFFPPGIGLTAGLVSEQFDLVITLFGGARYDVLVNVAP